MSLGRGLEMNMLKVYDFAPQILLPDRQHGPKRAPKSTFWGSKIDQKSIKMSPGRGLERDTEKRAIFDPKFSPPDPPNASKRVPKWTPKSIKMWSKKASFFVFVFEYVFNQFLMIFGLKKTPFLELISLKKHVDSKHVGF